MEAAAGMEHLERCVVCGGPLAEFERHKNRRVDLRYDICERCGLVQMNPRPTSEYLAQHYATEYRESFGDEDLETTGPSQRRRSAHLLEFWGAGAPGRHLDIGCSAGVLLGTFGAAEQVGVEPGAQHRALAEAAGVLAFASIDDLVASAPAPFDLITISHVLEHLEDPVGELARLRPLIAPEGRLLVEVPNLFCHRSYELPHLLAFSPTTLAATLAAGGFRVERRRNHHIAATMPGPWKFTTVIAEPAEPVPAPATTVHAGRLRAMRHIGRLPETTPQWLKRQERRVRRKARG